jgi:hypothetical protein
LSDYEPLADINNFIIKRVDEKKVSKNSNFHVRESMVVLRNTVFGVGLRTEFRSST